MRGPAGPIRSNPAFQSSGQMASHEALVLRKCVADALELRNKSSGKAAGREREGATGRAREERSISLTQLTQLRGAALCLSSSEVLQTVVFFYIIVKNAVESGPGVWSDETRVWLLKLSTLLKSKCLKCH